MTERNPAYVLQNRTDHPSDLFRMLVRTEFGSSEGVGDSTDLNVTQRGAGANMSVDVATGAAVIRSDDSASGGSYHVYNDATVNLAITTADATNARFDLIVAKVQDAFYTGAVNAWSLAVVQGTPAGSPADPAVPNNAIVLARVTVPAAAASIVNANITDLRPRVTQGNFVVNSARRPGITYGPGTTPYTGQIIYESDTNLFHVYNSAGAWVCTTPKSATITTDQTSASTSYIDLGTVGPTFSMSTGTKVLVTLSFQHWNTVGTGDDFMAIAVSGATTLAAADANAIRDYTSAGASSGDISQASRTFLLSGLTAGVNTFTAKYKTETGTAHFINRDMTVVAIP